jgi:hypothetical protein
MSCSPTVESKLNEYGIEIYRDYMLEKTNECVIHAEFMTIFVDEKEKTISISFDVTCKPEISATYAIILNQLGYDVIIMEPFIFDKNKEFVTGDKAYQIVDEVKREKIINEYVKELTYTEVLETCDGYEC